MERNAILEHLLAIEKTQAEVRTKLEEVAIDVQQLRRHVEKHAESLNGQEYRLSFVEKQVSDLREKSEFQQAALHRAEGMRFLIQGIIAIVAAASTAVGFHFWR